MIHFFSVLHLVGGTQQLVRSSNSWKQIGRDIDGEAPGKQAGFSVSMNGKGTILAIGGRQRPLADDYGYSISGNGNVHVLKWSLGTTMWEPMGSDIIAEGDGDEAGTSISINNNGTILAVGAFLNDGSRGTDSGHVRVFQWSPVASDWFQMGSDIDGEAAYDHSGRAVAISGDGNALIIGGFLNDDNGVASGHARIFEWSLALFDWFQKGSDIDGEALYDYSGRSVAINDNGSIIAIGAPLNNGNGTNSGHVRIFQWSSLISDWLQMGTDIDGEAAGDEAGTAVSLSGQGNVLAVGAQRNDGNGSTSGHVRVFEWSMALSLWIQKGSDLDGEADRDNSGRAVSLSRDGHTVAIGAMRNDGVNGSNSGHVRVFRWSTSVLKWLQQGRDIDGEAVEDRFGHAVALSSDGTKLAVGAINNDGNGSDSGHVRVFGIDNPPRATIDNRSASSSSGTELSTALIATITVLGVVVLAALIVAYMGWRGAQKRKSEIQLTVLHLQDMQQQSNTQVGDESQDEGQQQNVE